MKASLVNSANAPLAIKMSTPCEHHVGGKMAPSVRVKEIVCVAGASAIPQRVEAVTMVTSANVMMNIVRSPTINYVEVEYQSFSFNLHFKLSKPNNIVKYSRKWQSAGSYHFVSKLATLTLIPHR